jgi:glycosyltransferase involved in cell wall biosynthesis
MVTRRGGERVLWAMHETFPEAPIFTSIYDPSVLSEYQDCDVRSSYLGRWPFSKVGHEFFSFLRSSVFEAFDLSGYDLVISSCSAEAKGVLTGPDTLHISYIHTPTRYYWSEYERYLEEPGFGRLNRLVRLAMPLVVNRRRKWDLMAAQRPDRLIANSRNVAARIEKYYQRSADAVIYPPIDVERFSVGNEVPSGYLVVSKLIPYKRIDLAVAACARLGRTLTIVGEGNEFPRLRKMAGSETVFVGNVDEVSLARLYRQSEAVLFPGEEDFGMVPLEAMACGRPAIAYGRGGALESVIEGKTGVLFEEQTVDSLVDAILRSERCDYDSRVIRSHAEGFASANFTANLRRFVDTEYEAFRQVNHT